MSVEGWLRYCQNPEVQFHKENIYLINHSLSVCVVYFLGVNVRKVTVAQYLRFRSVHFFGLAFCVVFLLYCIQDNLLQECYYTSIPLSYIHKSQRLVQVYKIIFCKNVIIPIYIYLYHIFIKVRDWFSGLVFFSIFTLRANKSYHQNSIKDRAAYSVLAPIKLYPLCCCWECHSKNKLRRPRLFVVVGILLHNSSPLVAYHTERRKAKQEGSQYS